MKAGPKSAVDPRKLDLSGLPAKRDYRRIAKFAEYFLRVPKGTGALEPMKLRKWQQDIARAMYPATGRRPRQGLVSMPRGNGKSTVAAVFALYGLFADDVESAQVLIVASDERQARIVFNPANRMIERNSELKSLVQGFHDRIHVPHTASELRRLPAEPTPLPGYDPTLMIADDLHVVTDTVGESVSVGAGKRPESLTPATPTTAANTDSLMWRLVE